MDKLVRIKSIEKFRFFNSYHWNNSLNTFGKYNIIYGWNGSGKSTLSDFFYAIEKDALSSGQCTFQLCFQEDGKPESIITPRSAFTVAKRIKVYHQHYAQGLISTPDNVKHISIIGHDEGKAAEIIEVLIKEKAEWEGKLSDAERAEITITKEFEGYRRDRASLVRAVTNYNQSYNYNKIYEQYKQINNPVELSQPEYERLSVAVRTAPKKRIDTPSLLALTNEVCNNVKDVLIESPVFTTIEKLQESSDLRNWVQSGFKIHEDSGAQVCEFCNNPISPERWNELENYFSGSLTTFKTNISSVLQQLDDSRKHYDNYLSQLPHTAEFFDEYSDEYSTLKEGVTTLCTTYTSFISKAVELVKTKDERIIDTQCAADYKTLMSTIDYDHSLVEEIAELIDKHNIKADAFAQSIETDESKLAMHIIAQSAPKFKEFEKQLDENAETLRKAKAKIISIKRECAELDSKIKNSRIPAETINKDIQFIFGHSDLRFEWKENGYEIKRNDEIATCLSTGEQNAIALIYFFNSLQDSEVSKDNCIVILDDPVSSFDSNYYYSASAYIRDKLQTIGQAIILTHKFSLYKDFSRMFSGSNCYLLERENNSPVIKKEDAFLREYQDEYVYLFYKIYQFVKQPPSNLGDYLPYPNMGRRLLEGFVSFKLPEKYTQQRDILTKAIEMDGDANTSRLRAITRLVQNQSHLRLVGAYDSVENILDIKQLPDIFQHLLDFIKKHDLVHYETLVKQVDPERTLSEDEQQAIQERVIPLFDLPVSAGFGNRMDTYEPFEPYTTTNPSADFALKISGDSMAPTYCDGDIVIVKKQKTLKNAQIAIVSVDDEVFCKKIITTGNTPLLVSLNKAYPPRQVNENERFDVLGIVIDLRTPERLTV